MLGCVNQVEKVIELVHRNGGVVLVDAAQSAPHMKVDVQALDADFVAFSGHKLMAPMGIGVLYGKEKLLDAMPPFLTGGEMIDSVTRDGAVYAELPHKFEAGTVNAGGAVALAAAIDYLESVGLENVHAQEQALTRYAYEGMKKIPGVNILGSDDPDKHCGILSFTVDGVHRTTLPPFWTAAMWTCVPGTTVHSRCWLIWVCVPAHAPALHFITPPLTLTAFWRRWAA